MVEAAGEGEGSAGAAIAQLCQVECGQRGEGGGEGSGKSGDREAQRGDGGAGGASKGRPQPVDWQNNTTEVMK